jgi:hypothetical protein
MTGVWYILVLTNFNLWHLTLAILLTKKATLLLILLYPVIKKICNQVSPADEIVRFQIDIPT